MHFRACLLYTSGAGGDTCDRGQKAILSATGGDRRILWDDAVRPHGADAVSYTHLDVYKRQRYNEAFGKMPELILQKEIPESDTTWHLYVLHLNLENLNCDRRQCFDALYAENTCPQVHYLSLIHI